MNTNFLKLLQSINNPWFQCQLEDFIDFFSERWSFFKHKGWILMSKGQFNRFHYGTALHVHVVSYVIHRSAERENADCKLSFDQLVETQIVTFYEFYSWQKFTKIGVVLHYEIINGVLWVNRHAGINQILISVEIFFFLYEFYIRKYWEESCGVDNWQCRNQYEN